MMAMQTSLGSGYSTQTLRRMRAGFEDDYSFHDSADSPIFDVRPLLQQSTEESSDQILDKLELAGRVPSKEKFRRMACNTFIYTGICPYNDRCVFLHDHRIKAENVKVRTTRQCKASNVIKDTFYWPDMTRRDVARTVDPQGLPSANQMYIIPESFACNPGNYHNRGLYSMWTHFVEFCLHNSVFYTTKRYRDVSSEPFFLMSGYRENPHVPGAKRLDSFIRLSLGRGVGVARPAHPPPSPQQSAARSEGGGAGNGNTVQQRAQQQSQVLPKLAAAAAPAYASSTPKRRDQAHQAQITPDSITSVGKSFFGGGPPRQAQFQGQTHGKALNAYAPHFEMPSPSSAHSNSHSKAQAAAVSVPMLKKVTMNMTKQREKDKAEHEDDMEEDSNKGLGTHILSSLDSLTEDLYYDTEPSHNKIDSECSGSSLSLWFNHALTTTTTVAATNTHAKATAAVTTATSVEHERMSGLFASSIPLWLDSLSGDIGSGDSSEGFGPFSVDNNAAATAASNTDPGQRSGLMFTTRHLFDHHYCSHHHDQDKADAFHQAKSGADAANNDHDHECRRQWSPAGLLNSNFGLLDEGQRQTPVKAQQETQAHHVMMPMKDSGNGDDGQNDGWYDHDHDHDHHLLDDLLIDPLPSHLLRQQRDKQIAGSKDDTKSIFDLLDQSEDLLFSLW